MMASTSEDIFCLSFFLFYFCTAFKVNNLMIDPVTHPKYAFYCGKSYLIVKVTDVKNMNSPIDPVPENNLLAKPITLLCQQGKEILRLIDTHHFILSMKMLNVV